MEKRTSFIFYSEWWEHIEMLPDGEALSVIRAIFLYQRNETVPSLAGAAAMAFSFIRAQLDRDAEQWERVRQARADAGRTGGLKTQRSNRELKQTEANAFLLKQAEANQAVNVNEDGNVNGNVNGIKRKRFSPPSVDEVAEYCTERGNHVDAERFVDFYTANGWTQGRGKPIKDWRACVRTWERSDRVAQKERMTAYDREL